MRMLIKILVVVCFISCQQDRLDIPVPKNGVKITMQRFDKEIFNTAIDSLNIYHPLWHKKYGEFYERYVENILRLGLANDPALGYHFSHFLNDKYVKELYQDCAKKYAEITSIEQQLSNAFNYYRHYFPDKKIPEVLTYISGMQYKVVVTPKTLGIGLDMFLGSNYENYSKSGFPKYLIQSMNPENLVPDAIRGWISTEFDYETDPKDLLTAFVRQGKIMYVTDALLPHTPDSLKIAYTKNQLIWCKANEFEIWAHFVDEQLLYNSSEKKMAQYLSEGPFTSGFQKESPSRIGVWVGWKIVRSFMNNNPNVSLAELMKMDNAQVLLKKSKYKPKK